MKVFGAASLAVLMGSAGVAAAPIPAAGDDPLAAVAAATPRTVAAAADVATTATGTNALDATVAGIDVRVPVDPAAGISLGDATDTVSIGLPFAQEADDATAEKAGVLSYDNNNGTTTVPVVQKDGSLQINAVLENAGSPARQSYPVDINGGGSLTEVGDLVIIANDAGDQLAAIEAPWAKDAAGKRLPTHYEIEGTTLTQVIDLSGTDVVYPVVADPKFVWAYGLPTVKTTRSETAQLRGIGAGPAGTAGGAAQVCAKVVSGAGIAGAVLRGVNIVSIMYNARNAYGAGKCSQLLIGPGVVGTVAYKDSYCK